MNYIPPPSSLPAKSRVWLYLRDSGGSNQWDSINQQETQCRAFCKDNGLMITEVFRDEAKSGGSVDKRNEFKRMMELSETNPPHGLLIWNFARFSRDLDDAPFYKAILRHRKIIIHSLTDPIPDDPLAGRMMETMIEFANAEKRRQNSRDVKRGLASLVAQGFAPGTPPKGYIRVQVPKGKNRDGKDMFVSKWEPDPELKDLIIMAFEMRLKGRSYREIQAATHNRIYKSVNCWFGFFKNRTYTGEFKFGGKVYPDHHAPIITYELFDAVQRLKRPNPVGANNPFHARRIGVPSLLSGIAYCMECGAMMVHNKGAKVHPWHHYICGKRDRQGTDACPSKRVSEKHAIEAILKAVTDQVLSAEYLTRIVEMTRAKYGDASGIIEQMNKVQGRIDDLDLSIARIWKAIERTGSERAYERHEILEQERSKAQNELEVLKSQADAAKIEITPEAMQIVLETWKEQLAQVTQSNDVRLLKAWLMRFVSRIDLSYNQAKIYYTYPLVDFSQNNSLRELAPSRWGHKRVALTGDSFIYGELCKHLLIRAAISSHSSPPFYGQPPASSSVISAEPTPCRRLSSPSGATYSFHLVCWLGCYSSAAHAFISTVPTGSLWSSTV